MPQQICKNLADMTSYQKLKQQNEALTREVILLSTRPDSMEAISIRAKWQTVSEAEYAVWAVPYNPDADHYNAGILALLARK